MTLCDSIKIGELEISPPLFLAPMAGLTHSAFRQLLLDFGGVGLLSTEMLSAARLPGENPERSPYLVTTQREHPISYQLFVYRKEHVEKAVEKIEALGADAIDINLGCGAPKVRKKGGGIALASDFERLSGIVGQIKRHSSLPLTAKIRIGRHEDEVEFIERCKRLEGMGIDALYIHARLDREPFCRPPRWAFLSCLHGRLSIPYMVNGGIFSKEDAERALDASKANGVMIGRACAVRPWIFREIECNEFFSPRLPEIYFRFFEYLAMLFPVERQIGRMKEFTHYFSRNYAFGNRFAMAVQRSGSMEEIRRVAEEFFKKNDPAWG